MVVSLGEVRTILSNYIRDMGHNPSNVLISNYENKITGWVIHGEFQQGYLGDTLLFEAFFDPKTNTLSKFTITGKKDSSKQGWV